MIVGRVQATDDGYIATTVVKDLPCPKVWLDDVRSLRLQTTTPGDDWTSGVASCGEQVEGVQSF